MRLSAAIRFLVVAAVWASAQAVDVGVSDESRLLSNTRQLTFEGRRAGEGYFSADGTKLVFQSERDSANPFYQIYLMDLETGDVLEHVDADGEVDRVVLQVEIGEVHAPHRLW